MPTVTPKDKKPGTPTDRKTIVAKTKDAKKDEAYKSFQWWTAQNDNDLGQQLISTGNYLKKQQKQREKQASLYSTMYNGKPIQNYALNSTMLDVSNRLPPMRSTLNVAQSCIDTLVSRISQSNPRPVFLTDNGHYKERNISKQLNAFIAGEFYRCEAYDKGTASLRKSCILGNGFIKIFEKENRVALEETLELELLTDKNDAFYGNPRNLIQLKTCDRGVAMALFPKEEKEVATSATAYIDNSTQSSDTISDQIMIYEGWHLPSGKDVGDGRHVIACSGGILLDEPWTKEKFPFVKMSYSDPVYGWFGQGLIEMNFGTQIQINLLLAQMEDSIRLVGVPRIFVDETSRVTETAFNNNIGTIIKYRGTKPSYEISACMPQEAYEHLQRLITYYYQQTGVSQLAASGQKPPGLNSGEAQRVFLETQDDRFSALAKRYDKFYIDLAYQMIDVAKEIAEREGQYSTVYPNKDGTREIDLPKAGMIKDTYVIQCYDESSLPRDPAGRYARLSEMLAAGEISLPEFRRMSGFPDLEQSDKLANALEERILHILDDIVEKGESGYKEPDVFMLDPSDLATTLVVQYMNLYADAKLEESKMQLLRDFFTGVQNLKQQATAPQPQVQQGPPQAQGQLPAPQPPQASTSPVSNVQV